MYVNVIQIEHAHIYLFYNCEQKIALGHPDWCVA